MKGHMSKSAEKWVALKGRHILLESREMGIFEAQVVDVSPSGKHVQVALVEEGGAKEWLERTRIVLAEILPENWVPKGKAP